MGHHPSLTLPAYHPYLAGRRGGMDIINVEHTLPSLRKACGVVRDICRDDGVVVFIAGGREIMREPLMKAMERIGQANCHAVTGRYKPGTMTNAAVM
jgi:small subunit ribosomal protein S2